MSDLLTWLIRREVGKIHERLKEMPHLDEEETNALDVWKVQLIKTLKDYARNQRYSETVSHSVQYELERLNLLVEKNHVSLGFEMHHSILTKLRTRQYFIMDGPFKRMNSLFAIEEILKRLEEWQVRLNSPLDFTRSMLISLRFASAPFQ